jgi:hypothetical protein
MPVNKLQQDRKNYYVTYYSMPTLSPQIANSYDLVLGPVIPNCYRFMGSIDNLYIKKYP